MTGNLKLFQLLGTFCFLAFFGSWVMLRSHNKPTAPAATATGSVPGTNRVQEAGYQSLDRRDMADQANHRSSNRSMKIINLWSTYYQSANWEQPVLGQAPFRTCAYKECLLINDHSFMDADLVLFHCRSASFTFPDTRHQHQIYTLICGESPTYTSNMARFGNKINMTMSYRLDADVLDRVVIQPKTYPVPGPYVAKESFSKKTKNVVWLVSHCKPVSQRDLYAQRLAKYIDLDIYGGCGQLKCPRKRNERCFRDFEKIYKFYLSFENSVCKDYVTEKFFNPLNYELVPIVLGGANYSKVAPPGAYINIRDFKSPKHLADYLKYLSRNETAYLEYFKWKQDYTLVVRPNKFCKLCEILTKGTFQRDSTSREIGDWYSYPGVCKNDMVKDILRNKT